MTQNGLPSSPPLDLLAPSLLRRMACWTYEGMLLFGVMVSSGLVYFIAAYWLTGLAPGEMNIHPQLKSGLQAISFFVLGLYFTWMWHRGQSLAMKTWRIEIVDKTGARLSRALAHIQTSHPAQGRQQLGGRRQGGGAHHTGLRVCRGAQPGAARPTSR